ncbi:MAG: glycosyltransferase [Alphaproteobacteria bacterium]|nr:glycosyltransferase [Alphaproteobacteria bacterium]
MRQHLILFAKAPRLGSAKRRLAAELGALAAWRFHRGTLAAVARRLGGDRRWRTWLALTPDHWPGGRRLVPHALPGLAQGRGDLGQRMARALRAPPRGPAVLIGADIPAVRPAHIAAAFRALGHADAVFGPATDGGYWLVGLARRRTMPGLFHNVRWSSPWALADTLRNLPAHRRAAQVARLHDVDTAADLVLSRLAAGAR